MPCCVPPLGETGRPVDHKLTLFGQKLPLIANTTIKFLGLPFQIQLMSTKQSLAFAGSCRRYFRQRMCVCVQSPGDRNSSCTSSAFVQDLALSIFKFPISWIEGHLKASATHFLQRWTGLSKPANPNLFYLTKKEGGWKLVPGSCS